MFEEEDFQFEDYDRLYDLIVGEVTIKGKQYFLREEIELFYTQGNKEAGKRVRYIMQMIRNYALETRNNIQEFKRDMLD